MADDYIHVPFETDPSALAEIAFAYMRQTIAGWEPEPAQPDTNIIEACSFLAAELMDVASEMPDAYVLWSASRLHGIQPIVATEATILATFTLKDDDGHTIDEGTEVGIRAVNNDLYAFQVPEDVIVPAGETTAVVRLVASETGSDGNGLGANAQTGVISTGDNLFIDTVVLNESSSGGEDDEELADFLNRVRTELSLLSASPRLDEDYEKIARSITGIKRALCIDGYDYVNKLTEQELMCTVFIVGDNGLAVGSGAKAALTAEFTRRRGTNFVVHLGDPTYTTINVEFEFTTSSSYDPVATKILAEAAVAAYLDPTNYGRPDFGDADLWEDKPVVRFWDIVGVLKNVTGLKSLDSLFIGKEGQSLGASDITLDGPAAEAKLPLAGDIEGTPS